ncbi:MAG: ATP-binding protein [Cyanobacteria bacterium J06639_18]
MFKNYDVLPLVECYPGQLNQVFMNILINAIDSLESDIVDNYSHLSKFPTPQIHIQTKKINKNRISINITDNGTGIEPKIFAKLFDPFFTTKDVGKGTGLGLSISYQIIVDEHGGNLSFQSTLGRGASFTIEIPITHSLSRLHSRSI